MAFTRVDEANGTINSNSGRSNVLIVLAELKKMIKPIQELGEFSIFSDEAVTDKFVQLDREIIDETANAKLGR